MAAILCLTYAYWRGGSVERGGATVVLVFWIIAIFTKPHGRPDNFTFALVHVAALIAAVSLAIWSHKSWTLFFAACHLIAVAAHVAAALSNFGSDAIGWWTYSAVENIFGGWGVLAALAFGVWQHQRKLRGP